MAEEDLGTFQMLWDCTACETPKLLGLTHRYCPNCGSAQDPQRRYFPADGEGILVEDHIYAGRDKICAACDTPNSGQAQHCTSCGSGLADAKEAAVRQTNTSDGATPFEADNAKAARADFKAQKQAQLVDASAEVSADKQAAEPKPENQQGSKKWLLIAIAAVAVLVICVIVFMNWTKESVVEVTGHTWARTIDIEQFRTKSASAWKGQLPSVAYQVRCKKEKRGSTKVPDGETCTTKRKDQGIGTFKKVKICKTKYKSVPKYADKCRYKIDKWSNVRTIKATEVDQAEPTWPQFRLAKTGQCLGCERTGKRTESYKVTFQFPDNTFKDCSFDQAKWSAVKKGSRWRAKIRVMGGGLVCDSLESM